MFWRGSRFIAALALTAAAPTTAQFMASQPGANLATVVVGDLRNADQRSAFDEQAKSTCGRTIPVLRERINDATPAGTFLQQNPASGRRVACIGRVTLYYSKGSPPQTPPQTPTPTPTPTPPSPPPAPPPPIRINVPRLDSDAVRERFAAVVRERCNRPFNVQIRLVAGQQPSRSYVRQYPDAGRSIGCDSGAVAYLSDGSVPAPVLRVPVLDTYTRRAGFENRASHYCMRPYQLRLRTQPDSRTPGSYVTQNVPPGSTFSCASIITVTVTAPPPPWLMPDLRQPAAATELQRTANERCHALLPVFNRPQDSTWAEGALIAQDPPAGTVIDCNVRITLTRARKITPPPHDSVPIPKPEGGPPRTTDVPQTSPPEPMSPPRLLIGDLSSEAGITALETAAQTCPGEWHVKRAHRPSSRNPAGAFDGQDPDPATEFRCELSVRVWSSDGEAGTGHSMKVPDYVGWGVGAVDDWKARVAQMCGSAGGVTLVEKQSDKKPGRILSQSRDAGAPYKCGEPMLFTVAVPAPPPFPWWPLAVAGALLAAGTTTYVLRHRLWPPIPMLEIGAPISAASVIEDDPTVALPLVALESLCTPVMPACPDGVPIESVEIRDG